MLPPLRLPFLRLVAPHPEPSRARERASSSGAPPRQPRGRRLLALALTLFVVLSALPAPAPAQTVSNPELYRKSLEAAAQATRQYGLVDDTELEERVTRIGYALASQARFQKFPFTFSVIDMPIPNAFALPAGQIFVTRGMLDLGLDDDMLAALLGHEIVHVTEEHFLHLRRRATLLNVLSSLLTVGAIAADRGSRDDAYQGPGGIWQRDSGNTADLLQGAQATSAVVGELLLRSYSRENEDESDEVGQRLAAAAGYDPDGARRLMAKMRAVIPQSKSFGYWQTHPFFDDRVRAAEARSRLLKPNQETDAAAVDGYRQRTQKVLLAELERKDIAEPLERAIEAAALAAWPEGPASDRLRLEKLHELRDLEMEKLELSRDYGTVIAAYRDEIETVRRLTPESELIASLESEIVEMSSTVEALYPKAIEVLDGGVYETSFLQSFLSNYPDSQRAPEVALALGTAYSRLGRETDAVEQLANVWESVPQSDHGQRAARGLRALVPLLEELAALEMLAEQDRDQELAELAASRLEQLASHYQELRNGAEYLARFPQGQHAEVVNGRLDELAEHVYREMTLYQQLGDVAKAVDRASRILEYAPLSPAAERLTRSLEKAGVSG
ncbi:MAG TPA: M48 family metalloprotease [Thermoanaerobaculia bacterium]|nr:M48 family metalloprotease [Thermoanaerobaculia bacterium]